MRLLMVCMGNICRSPMMEGWLADAIAREPSLRGIEVDSAAIGPWHAGQSPDRRAIDVALRHGIDISMQRARQLRAEDFGRFDLLLFADADTLRDGRAMRRGQGDGAEAWRYLDWAGVDGDPDIADPYYGDASDFEAAWRCIAGGGERIVQRLLHERAA